MAKASSAEDYKLGSSFEEVKKKLREEQFADRWDKPLAYWALPNDRRLPLAFLGRTVGELLQTPFRDLSATAGIGQKKISSLVKLLHRAIQDEVPDVPFGISELTPNSEEQTVKSQRQSMEFDPSLISEALWAQWRETIRKHNVGDEKLGRLAPTLQALPTVIWHTPISTYLDYTMSEIRQLKTHGEKRVRVVLEVFCILHEMLANANQRDHLQIRIAPRFVDPIERWVRCVIHRWEIPSPEEIRESLAIPLLTQVKIDVGPMVHKLAEGRLGIRDERQNVRNQSRRLGVTRARVYQLLDDCSKAIQVRWPAGERQLGRLGEMFQRVRSESSDLELFHATRELFFPDKGAQRDGSKDVDSRED